MVSFVVVVAAAGCVFSKALRKEAHSMHQALQEGTNGCNLGNSMAISSPHWNNSASDR